MSNSRDPMEQANRLAEADLHKHCDAVVRSMESERPRQWPWRLMTIGRALGRMVKGEVILLPGLTVLAMLSAALIARPFVWGNAPVEAEFVWGAAAAVCAHAILRFTQWLFERRNSDKRNPGWSVFCHFVVVPVTLVSIPTLLGASWRDAQQVLAIVSGAWATLLVWIAFVLSWIQIDTWRNRSLRAMVLGEASGQVRIIRAAIHGRELRWWSRRNFVRWVRTQAGQGWTPNDLDSLLAMPDGS